ncbi:hypothetical protein DOT_2058, partial [Desulfosporosinus sp. OT]
FKPQNFGDMLLLHAQDIKKAEFLFAPFNQKAVGIEEKNHCENSNHIGAQIKDGLHLKAAGHFSQALVLSQENHDVIHHHRAYAGQDVGQIGLGILFQIGGG